MPHQTNIDVEIRDATRADLDTIVTILDDAELPTDDVESWLGDFIVATSSGTIVGVAAVERHDTEGLLRSVAVPEAHRGTGLAGRLVAAIVERCREDRLEALYLLTTTAERYFGSRGFTTVARTEAPIAIRHTQQFAALCPDSAVLMYRALTD